MSIPDHMRGPEWRGWDPLFAPSPIAWITHDGWITAQIADYTVAYLRTRPQYCDRGHFMVVCDLPGLDGADGFPRYYMSKETAVRETEAFLRWRLWKERTA